MADQFIGPAIGSAPPRRVGTRVAPASEMQPTYPAWGLAIPSRHVRTHPGDDAKGRDTQSDVPSNSPSSYDQVPNCENSARFGSRSALLHQDEAAVHGPSFCYPGACDDLRREKCESGANTPESLFIVTRCPVNKKQPFRRIYHEKNAQRDHERTL
jgi:hypothetical protein